MTARVALFRAKHLTQSDFEERKLRYLKPNYDNGDIMEHLTVLREQINNLEVEAKDYEKQAERARILREGVQLAVKLIESMPKKLVPQGPPVPSMSQLADRIIDDNRKRHT